VRTTTPRAGDTKGDIAPGVADGLAAMATAARGEIDVL
jgi:hypothetical protein